MPKMEPLALDRIVIRPGPEFNAVFTNLQVNGPASFVVEKLKWVHLNEILRIERNAMVEILFQSWCAESVIRSFDLFAEIKFYRTVCIENASTAV